MKNNKLLIESPEILKYFWTRNKNVDLGTWFRSDTAISCCKKRPILDKLKNTSTQLAIFIGIITYAIVGTLIIMNEGYLNSLLFVIIIGCSLLTSALFLFILTQIKKSIITDKRVELFLELIKNYDECEATYAKELSNDTKLTKQIMIYRRDMRDVIDLMNTNYTKNCLIDYAYSAVSLSQLQKSILSELYSVSQEAYNAFSNCKLASITGDKALFYIQNESSQKAINDTLAQSNEVFKLFGLEPDFIVKDYQSEEENKIQECLTDLVI